MSAKIKIVMFLFSLILFIIISRLLKKEKIPVMYSIIWFFVSFLILLVSIVPSFLTFLATFLGFEAMSSMVIGMMLVLLLTVSIILTMIISNQKKIIISLVQEVSLLKEKTNGK